MYLTVKQTAGKLGVSSKTVFRYIADGKLKAYKLSQRCVRIDETDLEKFVKGT